MKTKLFSKLAVTMMTVALGAGIVGSISGTVAWFQYSTRSTVAYEGAAAHCSENLQIRIRHGDDTGTYKWEQDLSVAKIKAYLEDDAAGNRVNSTQLRPVTSGELNANKVATKFYKNPIYQYASTTTWGEADDQNDYVVIPLELRVKDVTGSTTDTFLAKKIYISDVTLQGAATQDTGVTTDVSPALRMGVKAGETGAATLTDYATFSKDGADVDVFGALDLNGDGHDDKDGIYSDWAAGNEIVYGDKDKVAKATGLTKAADDTTVGVANDADPYDIVGKEIGSTAANKTLSVDLVIYIEGWTKLGTGSAATALWDAGTSVGYKFNAGIRFSAEAHNDND